MIEFSVQLANEPGQLARVARELGNAGVNIQSLAAMTTGPDGVVKMVVDHEDAARAVLDEAGLDFTEHRVVRASLDDQPGALADLADALAGTGVNIEAVYLIPSDDDRLHFALAVDDPDSAERAM